MAGVETQLKEQFGHVMDDKEVMNICADICTAFKLAPESLRYKWEALKYNSSDLKFQELDVENARNLRVSIKRELESKAEAAAKVRQAVSTQRTRLNRPFASASFGAPSQRKEPSADRKPFIPTDFVGSPVKFEVASARRPYRYMFEKLSERSEALDTRIDKFAELLRNHYQLDELGDPAAVTEHEVVVVGRIVGEADSKLQESTLMLESSRILGSGGRIPLKFDPNFTIQGGMQSINLWPGMIFAARGKNGGGGWFSVTDFIELPLPARPPPAPEIASPFSMAILSGPFTSEADTELKFQSLQYALSKLKDDPPSILCLLGPFLDTSHPSIRTGKLAAQPVDLFGQRIGGPLTAFARHCPSTRILLITSVKDVLNPHFVFPQAPMPPEGLRLPSTATLLSNPCSFTANGVRFGASTVDVLFHARRDGFTKRTSALGTSPEMVDNMQQFCRQILSQKTFYPVFPAPKDNSHEVNLDVSHLDMLDFESVCDGVDTIPDVLILPSMLKQFSKTIEEVSVVNPPTFSKSNLVTKLSFDPSSGSSISERMEVNFVNLI